MLSFPMPVAGFHILGCVSLLRRNNSIGFLVTCFHRETERSSALPSITQLRSAEAWI